MDNLPFEIYDLIIGENPCIYQGLLGVRNFAVKLNSGIIQNYQKRFMKINGNRTYFKGKLHSFFGLHSLEFSNGNKLWHKNGDFHRDNDLPAVEYIDGTKEWYQYGELHRDNDLPAIEYANGTKKWYQRDKLHRDNDLPAIEYPNGDKFWYRHGELYRAVRI